MRVIGIDIGASHVRAALVMTSYRKVTLERLFELERTPGDTLEQALQACFGSGPLRVDALAVSVDGEHVFVHRISLPASARKQLDAVLPFEVEAQLPIEIDDVVFDHRAIGKTAPNAPVNVITAAARIEAVRGRIEAVKAALKSEPDRVGGGSLPLANLATIAPALAVPGPIAIADLGSATTELVVLENGEPVFARCLLRGMRELPAGAPALAAELRQTLAAWAAQGQEAVQQLWLVGTGAMDPQASAYLAYNTGVPTEVLGTLNLVGVPPLEQAQLPRYAKAIGLALGLGPRPRDLDLRQGPLERRHGYDFLKEKMPLLAGLVAAIAISVLFSTWAELRVLERERVLLESALGTVSKEVLGEELTTPEAVMDRLGGRTDGAVGDPMPHADAFDLMVELSDAIPSSITHDLDELDVSARSHVKMNGIVPTKNDAQQVEAAVRKWKCAKDVKLGKLTQAVGSSKQKYVLEFDLRCPEDEGKRKKPKKEDGAKEETPKEGTP